MQKSCEICGGGSITEVFYDKGMNGHSMASRVCLHHVSPRLCSHKNHMGKLAVVLSGSMP